MNKKGFTLIEILVTIILISIVTALVSTGIILVNKNSKLRINKAKMDIILTSAQQYGKDHRNIFDDNGEATINIEDLIKRHYLECDIEYGNQCSSLNGCILNEDDEIINNTQILISKTSNGIKAYLLNDIHEYTYSITLGNSSINSMDTVTGNLKTSAEEKYVIVPDNGFSLSSAIINCDNISYKFEESTGTIYLFNIMDSATCNVDVE